MQVLVKLPSADTEEISHLTLLVNTVNDIINMFNSLQRPTDQWDDMLIFFAESKLTECTKLDSGR